MSRIQLKERQFEPIGKNLGEFSASDLESFDLTFTDSDEQPNGTEGGGQSDKKQGSVPNPIDDNPLGQDNNQKQNSGQSGSSGGSSSGGNQQQEKPKDSTDPEDINDIPDDWDPYGQDLDDQDPDMPDPQDDSHGDSDQQGGAGSAGAGDGGSSGDGDDNDVPSQVPDSSQSEEGEEDSDGSGDSGSGQSGQGNDSGSSDGEESGNGDSSDDSSGQSSGGQSSGQGSDGEDGESSGGTSNDDFEDMVNDYDSEDSEEGESKSGKKGNSSGGSSDSSSQSQNKGQDSGSGSSGNSSNGGTDGGGSYDLDLDNDSIPSDEELEAEDRSFDPSELGTLSELEEALKNIEENTADSVKERQNSEENRTEQEETTQQNQRDRNDEIAAAKDMVGKAVKDVQNDETVKSTSETDDDDYYNRNAGQSQDDILKDLGAGNLTTLFNPGNLSDWRSRLDRLFDQALGFDIVTNSNLINKKIEDAPPGREDELPQVKNILVLLDMSGSMGADKFKQVISHIDTMLRAKKLTGVYFHIVGFGTRSINDIPPYTAKVKGARFKSTMLSKFGNDAGWGTYLLPAIVYCSSKVKRPDAVIIMTDGEIFDNPSEFQSNSKVKMFMKRNKNKIIWALTANGDLNRVCGLDPTAKSRKRYIKFKAGR